MEAAATKAAADATAKIIEQGGLLGSLLILALLGCCLLGWLLYRSTSALNAVQEKRVEEVRGLSKLLSENAANSAALIKTINDRTPIQEQMARDISLILRLLDRGRAE